MTEEIQGTRVHYQLLGEGTNRILFLHGWGCDLSLMKPVAEQLTGKNRVLLIDFPGHGESGRPPEPWGVPEYGRCLEDLLRKLDFVPCSVIAHSFGCRVATWLAAEKPELFRKLVFTGGAGIRPQPTEEAQKRGERYQKLKKAVQALKKLPLAEGPASRWEQKLKRKYGSRDYNALDPEMQKTFVRVINQDLTPLYEKIRASTLLIWGDRDTETPLWMGEEMERRIPDAGLVVLENGTHFAYLEQLQRFATIVNHFLKEDASL